MEDTQDSELQSEFVSESLQSLQAIEQDLLALETDGGSDRELVNRVFRAVHSIKGAGSYLGLETLVRLSHLAEALLEQLRSGTREASAEVTDAILAAVDGLVVMLNSPDLGASHDCSAALQKLNAVMGENKGAGGSPSSSGTAISAEVYQEELEKAAQAYSGKGYAFLIETDLAALHEAIDVKEGVTTALSSIGKILFSNLPLQTIDTTMSGNCRIYLETVLEQAILCGHFEIPEKCVRVLDMQGIKKRSGDQEAQTRDATSKVQSDNANSARVLEAPKAHQASTATPSSTVSEKSAEQTKPPAASSSSKASDASQGSAKGNAEQTMRVPVHILHDLLEWTGTMVMARNQLMNEFNFSNSTAFRTLSQAITGVHETVIETRMQTTGTLFERYRRIVRDLSRQLGKEVALHIEGGDLELDRTILESFSDPLTHLIRNSMDHALEEPAEREKVGKNRQGNIFLRSYIHSGEIILEVEDDGRGISAERVCSKAISKGVITQEVADRLSEREKIMLIFQPGFSTKDEATDVSGRGVGMDVVRNNIEAVGGSIDVQTKLGSGTTFSAILPLAKALVSSSLTKALIIELQQERFAIPETAVSEIIRLDENAMRNVLQVDGESTYQLRDKLVALVDLRQALEMPESLGEDAKTNSGNSVRKSSEKEENKQGISGTDNSCLIVLQYRKNLFGAIVDNVVGIQEIIVRSSPKLLQNCTVYSGHTVLGNGLVSLILDINGLVHKLSLKFVDSSGQESSSNGAAIADGTKKVGQKIASQKMVVFSYADNEYFAIPLELVAIIDRISIDSLRTVGSREYCQKKQETISVMRLDSFLPISKFNSERKDCCLIRPAAVSYPIGILTGPDVSVIEVDDGFESRIDDAKGIVGTFLYNDKLVMLLDIFCVFEQHAPDKIKVNDSKTSHAKILVAEDSLFFRKLISQYIQREEWQVEIVNDGLEAWERLQQEPGRFNLVISDINMPRMDGFQLAVKIREDKRFDAMPLVALTTLSDQHFRDKGLSLGFDRYVVKIDKNQVRSTVAECLQIKRGKSEQKGTVA